MPLQFFDDSTFETRTLEEWMGLVRAPSSCVEAKSLWHLLDGTTVWSACEVLDCNLHEETFLIRFVHRVRATVWSACEVRDCNVHEETFLIRSLLHPLHKETLLMLMRYTREVRPCE